MEFIETTVFTRAIQALLSDDEYRRLQTELMENPERGDLSRKTYFTDTTALTDQVAPFRIFHEFCL